MTSALKLRIILFGLAILLSALLIGWAAHLTWRNAAHLGERLTSVQIESFQTADLFRANLQGLDTLLFRYERLRHPADRDRFLSDWKKMDEWIDVQRPRLTTPKEGQILDEINAAYDDYYRAATQLIDSINRAGASGDASRAAVSEVEKQSQRLLDLGYQLVEAHRESLSQFLNASRRELFYLRLVIFCALLLLLALGGWLAVMVYREMVAPLQVKLVESAAIIERQEKLASLGMLAAGVAHEIRNPLTAIKARLFTQQRRLKTGTPEFEDAHLIGQEISRLERIVKEILEFARPSDPHLEKVNAGALLRDVQTLLGPPLEKRQIALHIDGDTDVALLADQQQLKQVLINLVQNAADSIGERGSVRLSVKALDGGLPGHGGDAAVLEVRDTGKGIAPEVEKRLFDPFFTTKEHGTGLGLPLAARIVEKHGGQLRYQTQLNKGTTFGVVLPRAREP